MSQQPLVTRTPARELEYPFEQHPTGNHLWHRGVLRRVAGPDDVWRFVRAA